MELREILDGLPGHIWPGGEGILPDGEAVWPGGDGGSGEAIFPGGGKIAFA